MGEELQQNLKDYSYEAYGAVPLPTAVPAMVHTATSMPRDCVVPPVSDVSQDSIFALPPASYLAYREPCRVGYQQIYGPLASSDSTTRTHRAPCPAYPDKQLNNNASAPPCVPLPGTAYGQPPLDTPFRGMTGNAPAPPERCSKGTTHGFNDAGRNNGVPGISMANIYKDLCAQFINSAQSNIIMVHMESLPNNAGRSKVTIELEIVDG